MKKTELGLENYFKIQKAVLKAKRHPGDFCICAPTGSGKTLSYLLLLLFRIKKTRTAKLRIVLILPVVELVFQVEDVLKKILQNKKGRKFRYQVLVDSQSATFSSSVDILLTTPIQFWRLFQQGVVPNTLRYVVFDEADWIFSRETKLVVELLKKLSELENSIPPILEEKLCKIFVSASLDGKLTEAQFQLRKPLIIQDNSIPPGLLEYVFLIKEEIQRKTAFNKLLEENQRLFLVCFLKETEAKEIYDRLKEERPKMFLGLVTSKVSTTKKLEILKEAKKEKSGLLLTTSCLSRGFDLPFVKCIVNFSPPNTSKEYLHQVGRTARGKQCGKAYTIMTEAEFETSQIIKKRKNLKFKYLKH